MRRVTAYSEGWCHHGCSWQVGSRSGFGARYRLDVVGIRPRAAYRRSGVAGVADGYPRGELGRGRHASSRPLERLAGTAAHGTVTRLRRALAGWRLTRHLVRLRRLRCAVLTASKAPRLHSLM